MNRPGSVATALISAPTASARLPQTKTLRRPMLSASEPAVSSAAATPTLMELSSQVCASGPAPSALASVGMFASGPQYVVNARKVPSDAMATETAGRCARVGEVAMATWVASLFTRPRYQGSVW